MGADLARLPAPPATALEPLDWPAYRAYLEAAGVPAGLLAGTDPSAFDALAARAGGVPVATALAFDHEGDCGIFNMSTLETARRRGLATALIRRHLHAAAARGCVTASLQSTPMAERVYARAGFRDLGRFLEHVPAGT